MRGARPFTVRLRTLSFRYLCNDNISLCLVRDVNSVQIALYKCMYQLLLRIQACIHVISGVVVGEDLLYNPILLKHAGNSKPVSNVPARCSACSARMTKCHATPHTNTITCNKRSSSRMKYFDTPVHGLTTNIT